MALSKFIKNTSEQIERFKELRKYSPKLLSFRKQLAREGAKCSFNMYSVLTVEIISPVDGIRLLALLKEYNSLDVILSSPLLPYSIIFENCFTGIQLVERMKKSNLLK